MAICEFGLDALNFAGQDPVLHSEDYMSKTVCKPVNREQTLRNAIVAQIFVLYCFGENRNLCYEAHAAQLNGSENNTMEAFVIELAYVLEQIDKIEDNQQAEDSVIDNALNFTIRSIHLFL